MNFVNFADETSLANFGNEKSDAKVSKVLKVTCIQKLKEFDKSHKKPK